MKTFAVFSPKTTKICYNCGSWVSKDLKELIPWLHKEEAITEQAEDLFDMAVQARNISRLLLKTPLKTVALVGEYGSGKSGILKMADYYLKAENRNKLNQNNGNDESDSVNQEVGVITCTVAGWGFAKGSTAEHILECTINELSKHVDVLGLRIVPEQYAAALGSAGNVFLKMIAALATCWKSPLDILKRLDDVLMAIDRRLIIFLEDVDRNKNDEVFFIEIASLLDNLRDLKQVSFVLAIGQKYDAGEVLIKTAEHVENVPRLNRLHVLNALESFRSYCIERCPDIISTIPKNYDRDRMGWDRSEMVQAVTRVGDDLPKPVDAIVELTSNPRVLKHALRRTLTAWEKLAGEIDFDDLLIVNVLKVVDEKLFSFIDKNIFQLCALVATNEKESEDRFRKKLEVEYERAIDKAQYNVYATSKLLDALFLGLFDKNTADVLLKWDSLAYQHIANDEPTKYWERIKRGELYDSEIPDCEILRALRQWNEDYESKAFRNMGMVEALSNGERVFKKVHQFKSLISRDCLQKAASKQFDVTLKEHRNKASGEVCPVLNRWFTLKPEHIDEPWREWLLEEIKKALPISLRYANELFEYWFHPKHDLDENLRARIVEAAKEIFEKKPALLANVLDSDYIWSVFEFTKRFVKKHKPDGTFSPKQWQWLGQTLMEAAVDNPQIIGVHIAAMTWSYPSENRESQIEFANEFHPSTAELIFDNQQIDGAMKLLLLEGVDIEKYDEQSKKVLLLARAEASKWLKQNDNQPKD